MGKKKTGQGRGSAATTSRRQAGGKRPAASRGASASSRKGGKTGKHVDAIALLSQPERAAFFDSITPPRLIAIFEESFPSDLVSLLLDLKKSIVKKLFEMVAAERRKVVAEIATLYHHKEYLTNPLPLRVDTDAGIPMPNFYAILGVPRDVSSDDLKTAHRLLSRAYSPECFSPPMRKAGEERLREIQDAYENLKSAEKRARADRLLPNVSYLYPRRDQSWLESVSRLLV